MHMHRIVDVHTPAILWRELERAIHLPPASAAEDLTLCLLDPRLTARPPEPAPTPR